MLRDTSNMRNMTGRELKNLREAAHVSGQRLADKAGWQYRARVSQLEALAEVPSRSAQRYLEALAALAGKAA